jgi:glycosyltransferase involved in cell wall biosynthesis
MRPTIVYVHPHMMMRTGATNFVLVTATGLQARGWPVVVVTGRADPAIVGERKLEIVELGGPLPSDPRHWLALAGLERRLFAALDRIPHKVLFPSVHPANYWAFAYKLARPWAPCVWMCHEPSAFVHSWDSIRSLQGPMRLATMMANPPLQVIDRLLVGQTDYIIANSRFTAANVRRIYGRDVDAVVDSGVGPDAFDVPRLTRDSIVTLSSLIRFKRVDLAIQGYALARQELGDAMPPLIVAGDGPEAPALRALATQLGLDGHVCFMGKVSDEDKRALYARASVFVSTAPREPFGLVCVEAMAAGAAVLAPDQGGPSETVVQGRSGALYRSGDAVDLAQKLVSLLSDPASLDRLSAGARLRAEERYTTKRTIDSLDEALRCVAGIGR